MRASLPFPLSVTRYFDQPVAEFADPLLRSGSREGGRESCMPGTEPPKGGAPPPPYDSSWRVEPTASAVPLCPLRQRDDFGAVLGFHGEIAAEG